MRIEWNSLTDGHVSLGIYSYIAIEDETESYELVIGLLLFNIVLNF